MRARAKQTYESEGTADLRERDADLSTSKKSCCCHSNLSGKVIAGRTSYHVRVCPNVICPRTVWDRNVSAAINILYLFKNYNVDGNETPEAFRRAPPPAVAAVAPPQLLI